MQITPPCRLVAIAACAFLGACASAVDSTEASSNAASSTAVTVATKTLATTAPNCSVHIDYPQVTTPNADATAALARNLPPPTLEEACQSATADHRLTISRGFKVMTNAHGILSLRFDEMQALVGTGSIENSLETHTFDVRTGDALGLRDLLMGGGLDVVRMACGVQLAQADGASIPRGDIDMLCDQALIEDAARVATFTIDVAGINLVVDLPSSLHLGPNVHVMISWRTLSGSTKPVLAEFLGTH
jgi:hypothetical protein